MLTFALAAAVALTPLAAPVDVPAAAAVPCSTYPWAPECASYLGAKVRPDLVANGINLPAVSDDTLGKLIFDLCFDGRPRPELQVSMSNPATRDIALQLGEIQRVKAPYCG